MQNKTYYVYIISSHNKTLYIGMTNNFSRRVFERKNHCFPGLTDKYNCTNLVYFESSNEVKEILEREKQLKRWSRSKKLNLIKTKKPEFVDLSALFEESR